MITYEYKVVMNYSRAIEVAIPQLEDKLNELGKDGWEFCGEITQARESIQATNRYLTFKRPWRG